MKKKLQLSISISLFVILAVGVLTFTLTSYRSVYSELVDQIVEDNLVIGREITELIEAGLIGREASELIPFLQQVCEDVKLPNSGYICAVDKDGKLVALPGLRADQTIELNGMVLRSRLDQRMLNLGELDKGEVFQGYILDSELAKKNIAEPVDIIASLPISSSGIRLLVHQKPAAVKQRARRYIRPMLLVGLGITLLLSLISYFTVDRIVRRYHTRLGRLNQDLNRSNDDLKETGNRCRELNHVLYHDLAHPLNSIISHCDFMRKNGESTEKYRNFIRMNASYGLNLIEMVKRLLPLEDREIQMNLEAVSIGEILEISLKILERPLYDKQIKVVRDVPENVRVLSDKPTLCFTVLNNILTNAIKFSARKSSITISGNKTGKWFELVIQDQGVGMSQSVINNLFNLAQKSHNAGTEGEIGAGYGMPLVKRLVEEYGGSIQVESRVEGDTAGPSGTRVALTFEVAE